LPAPQRDPVEELCCCQRRLDPPGRALGCAGGAAGEEHESALPRWCGIRCARIHPVVYGTLDGGAISIEAGNPGRQYPDDTVEFGISGDCGDTFAVSDVAQLDRAEAGIHQHQPGTEFRGGRHGLHQPPVVPAQDGDGVARFYARVAPVPRESVGAYVEFVVGQRAIRVDERDLVR
jgi:hypothetical protein